MKIYMASSWRNADQPRVLRMIRELGHDVYDFRNPAPGNEGFDAASGLASTPLLQHPSGPRAHGGSL